MSNLKDRVLSSIDEKGTIELARLMVETPSVTGEENELAKLLGNFMRERGIHAELQEVERDKFQTIGRIRGSGGGLSLMLCGHLDIFPPSASMMDPYKAVIKNNRMYGAGIADMKAGTAAIIMAGDAIKRAGIELAGDLILSLPREEEIGGVGIIHMLKSGIKADMGVVTESTNLEISTVGAGITQFTISTLGKSVHIGSKEHGVDAVAKMAKVIDALNELKFTFKPEPRVPKLPRLVASTIIGGRGRNYDLRGAQNLSDYCTLLVDVRFWKSQNIKTIEEDIRQTLDGIAAEDSEFRYELRGVPSPFGNRVITRNPKDVPLNAPIIGIVQENHRYVTGKPPKFASALEMAGNDDGVHMNEAGIPTVTYGPGPGERDLNIYRKLPLVERWIDIDTILTCIKVLALTAFDVCTMHKDDEKLK